MPPTSRSPRDICVIVGAGEAGIAAAEQMRVLGFEGRIVLFGEEQEWPYARPPLSKDMLTTSSAVLTPIRPSPWYSQHSLDLRRGTRVTGVDAKAGRVTFHTDVGETGSMPYDQLIFATGAAARKLPGFCRTGIRYLRDAQDAASLRRDLERHERIGIIGGGIIGLEVASAAQSLNRHVTVIEAGSRVMERALAAECSQVVLELHRRMGARVLLRAQVREAIRGPSGICCFLSTGESLEFDLIIGAIGVTPNDDLARQAGCATQNGIVIDTQGQTTVRGIFAAGDVASFYDERAARYVRLESWQHARRHGAHVARAVLGVTDSYRYVPWFWTDQYGMNLQVTGYTDDIDTTAWRGEGDSRLALHFKDRRLVAATSFNSARDIRPASNLISSGWEGDASVLCDESLGFADICRRLSPRR